MLEVGRVVKVCDIDACAGGRMGALHSDQLLQFDPPELLLGRRAENRRNVIPMLPLDEYFCVVVTTCPRHYTGGQRCRFQGPCRSLTLGKINECCGFGKKLTKLQSTQ